MRIALDTNILAYLAGVSRSPADDNKIDRVRVVVEQLADMATPLAPTQALGELLLHRRSRQAARFSCRRICKTASWCGGSRSPTRSRDR